MIFELRCFLSHRLHVEARRWQGQGPPHRLVSKFGRRCALWQAFALRSTRGADEFVRVCSAGQCVDKPLVEGRVPTRRNAQRSQGKHQPAFQSPSSAQHSVTLPSTLIPQSRVGHSISSPHPNHCSPSLRFSIASILYHSASHCCLLHLLTIQDRYVAAPSRPRHPPGKGRSAIVRSLPLLDHRAVSFRSSSCVKPAIPSEITMSMIGCVCAVLFIAQHRCSFCWCRRHPLPLFVLFVLGSPSSPHLRALHLR